MDFVEYQKEAIKTMKPMSERDRNIYFALKLAEEANETASILTKNIFHDKPIDKEKLMGEVSDCLWFLAAISEFHNFTLEEVANYNIDKLKKRHGEKYNQEFYDNV